MIASRVGNDGPGRNLSATDSGVLDADEIAVLAAKLVEREMLPALGNRLKRKNRMEVMDEINPDGFKVCNFAK